MAAENNKRADFGEEFLGVNFGEDVGSVSEEAKTIMRNLFSPQQKLADKLVKSEEFNRKTDSCWMSWVVNLLDYKLMNRALYIIADSSVSDIKGMEK